MSDSAYIAVAWVATFGAVGLYALALVRRGRRLSKVVPASDRRWMSADSTRSSREDPGAAGAAGDGARGVESL